MPQVINTNVMSLNAQRNLTTSGTQMAQAIQRLSSGLRINSAKDDAAGLAISDRMTTQISGLNQAVRNANDGISLSQTTEGALQEVTSNLQRIRELSVQAANATNSASDLAALDQEVQQRIQEINRIATQTSFNGRKVLDGTFGNAVFQVGANVGETISVGFDTSMKTSAIGQVATAQSADLDAIFTTGAGLTLAAGDLTVTFNGGTTVDVAANTYTDMASLVTAINAASTTAGAGNVAALSGNEIIATNSSTAGSLVFGGTAAGTYSLGTLAAATAATTGGFDVAANAFTVQIAAGTAVSVVADNYATQQDLSDAINDAVTASGTTWNGSGDFATVVSGEIVLTNDDALQSVTIGGSAATALGLDGTMAAVSGTATTSGAATDFPAPTLQQNTTDTSAGLNAVVTGAGTPTPQAFATGDFSIAIGDADAIELIGTFDTSQDLADAINSKVAGAFASIDADGKLNISSGETITLAGAKSGTTTPATDLGFTTLTNAVSGDLTDANVLSVDEANSTILRVDAALTSVSTLRSTLGAIQNRFQSTINSLSAVSENLSASRSRILDTDFAAETAAMTRAQILQQAGTAMVAQANSAPQNVLSLLR